MQPKLIITLPEKTTANYLRRIRGQVSAEVEECVEPSGASLTIQINPSFCDSYAYLGDEELGVVTVDLIGDDE